VWLSKHPLARCNHAEAGQLRLARSDRRCAIRHCSAPMRLALDAGRRFVGGDHRVARGLMDGCAHPPNGSAADKHMKKLMTALFAPIRVVALAVIFACTQSAGRSRIAPLRTASVLSAKPAYEPFRWDKSQASWVTSPNRQIAKPCEPRQYADGSLAFPPAAGTSPYSKPSIAAVATVGPRLAWSSIVRKLHILDCVAAIFAGHLPRLTLTQVPITSPHLTP
jgi:hypothetical protein